MVKRAFDIVASAAALVLAAPVLGAAAVGIRLSDPGPALYRASRAGRNGVPFRIVKLRTMRVQQASASVITADGDDRVFPLGTFLRKTKLDELPQLWNVILGEMSIVGPRPEAVEIVDDHYRPEHRRTLDVAPGLASPGSIYNYTHGEKLIGSEDPERDYLEKLLPIKLGLELAYIDRASLRYDLAVIARTIKAIVLIMAGRSDIPDPPELEAATTRYYFPIATEALSDQPG